MSTAFDNPTFQHTDDAALCLAAAGGDRAAFGQIVDRYQNLLCAIAFSALGDLGRSEDVAQEAFVVAWRKLADLREPAKLKGWLCGIVRNLANNVRRRRATDLGAQAVRLDIQEPALPDAPSPVDQAIRREEEALLWGVLSQLPESYREPLVLFHRGQHSVAEVAEQLDLSEDAVKQRLSRGRKLLKAEMAAFVEETLRALRPGRAFTLAVLAALPGLGAATAVAGTLGAASETAGPLAAKATAVGMGAAVWGPLLGVLGAAFGYWAGDQATRYPRERAYYRKMVRGLLIPMIVFALPMLLMMVGIWNPVQLMGPVAYSLALVTWILGFISICMVWNLKMSRRWVRIVAEEAAAGETELPMTPLRRFLSKWEGRRWTSRRRFLGLPLIDIRCSDPHPADFVSHPALWRRETARGWIAVGDRAYGLIAVGNVAVGGVAFGSISVGAIAVGGAAFGGLCFGGLAIGAVALAGLAAGWMACGGFAAGWLAIGGGAFGWRAAQGGLAVAHDYAVGGHAVAAHANDAAAQAFVAESQFMSNAYQMLQSTNEGGPWMLISYLAFTLVLAATTLLLAYRRKRT